MKDTKMSYFNQAELEEQEEEMVEEIKDCEKAVFNARQECEDANRWLDKMEENLEKAKKDLLDFKNRD